MCDVLVAPLELLILIMDPRAGIGEEYQCRWHLWLLQALLLQSLYIKCSFQEQLGLDLRSLSPDGISCCAAIPVQKLVYNFHGSGAAALRQ